MPDILPIIRNRTNPALHPKSCKVEGCEKTVKANGYCHAHYCRWYKYGDPMAGSTAHGAAKRFIEEVVPNHVSDECLIWPFALSSNGYGTWHQHWGSRKTVFVHQIACAVSCGPKPSPELQAAHYCGVKACCNPRHLRWATRSENSMDKLIHGNHNDGERNPNCKLSDADIQKMKALAGFMKVPDIARLFSISTPYAYTILAGTVRTKPTSPGVEFPEQAYAHWLTVEDVCQAAAWFEGVVA